MMEELDGVDIPTQKYFLILTKENPQRLHAKQRNNADDIVRSA